MKKGNKSQKNIIFTEDEEKLLKIYLEEYNDTYPKILLLNSFEFFRNVIKGVEISMKEKINGFSQESKSKIEDYIIKKIYPSDYKFSLFIKNSIKNRNSEEISSHYFEGEILPHCEYDKCNGYYVHSCGEKFQFFKYKKPNSNSNLLFERNNNKTSPEKNYNQSELFLFCEKCEMIYKSNLIKFKCHLTGKEFYSKIKKYGNNYFNSLPIATWKEYHCKIVISDKMKCQKCNNKLYFISPQKVLCKECEMEFNPVDIKYKCLVCKNTFSSEAKVFDPLEYKTLKICLKEAILSKINAKPNNLCCGCKLDINKIKFIHKKQCMGELFLGELNNRKVVICCKCHSIGIYDNYIWTCPQCFKKFRDNKENNEDINEEQKDIIYSPLKTTKKNNLKILPQTEIKSILFRNNEQKENLNNLNNKEKSNKTSKEKINIKGYNKKREGIKQSCILKFLEKHSNSLSIQSRLFTEVDNKNIINIIEGNNNCFTNDKKRNIPMLSSELLDFTPIKKIDTKIIKIPKGSSNFSKIKITDSNLEKTSKNLDNLFKKEFDHNISEKISPIKKKNDIYKKKNPLRNNKNISDLPFLKNLNKIHKAISLKDVRYKNENNYLYNDYLVEKINNIKKYKILNVNKIYNSPCSSGDIISIPKKDFFSNNKQNTDKPTGELFSKIKNYNSSGNFNCGESEIIKIIKNIKQYQFKKSRKKSANNLGITSVENEHFEIKKNLRKKSSKIDLSRNIYDEEISKIKMLKDFKISDYKIIKQIGKGSFGQIFIAEDLYHKKYALKKIIALSEKEIKSLKQEYQILFDIQSNLNENMNKINIVPIYGLLTKQLDPTTYVLYVLMELGNCDWEKEILERKRLKKYYTEEELIDILFSLVITLAQLQIENISHRDIKPQNILVFSNSKNKSYKLADFGEAKELLKGNKPTEKQTLRGTELYMSPILFFGLRSRKIKKYIKHNPYKSDVFSLGLCTLFAATLCFESLYDIRELKSNVSIKIIIEKYLKKRYSYKFINIICNMLDIYETSRDDFIELKKRIEDIYFY